MPDPFKPKEQNKFLAVTKKAFKVAKAVLITRIPMNILLLLIIISLSIVGFEYMQPDKTADTPTGNLVLEQQCPECICEEKQAEQNCELCPVKTKVETKNVFYYTCPAGEIVKDLEECKNYFPNVSGESSGTVEGITLAIDNIEFEKDEEDTGFVTRVDYAIINRGEFPIVPKIEVKVYDEWTLKTKKAVANKVINPEIVVNPNDYVKRQDRVRIFFNGREQTVRLLLVDSLPTIEREIVAVTKDIDIDYAE